MLEILISFLPWIVLKFIGTFSLSLAMILAFASSFLTYPRLRKGFILDLGTLIFFFLGFIVIVVLRDEWFARYLGILSSASLALITWLTVLLNRPFTIEYAKLKYPKEVWTSPLFLKINKLITIAFGVLFFITTVFEIYRFYHPLMGHIWSWISFSITIGFALFFPKWFPKWYKKRKGYPSTPTLPNSKK